MSIRHSIGRTLMACAAALAPREKAEWMRAMRAEFDAADETRALSWAAGCLGTSLLWRASYEAVYVVMLVVATMAFEPVMIFAIEKIIGEDAPTKYLFDMTHASEHLYFGLTTFLLCIYRPRRLLLTALLVPLFVTIIPTIFDVCRVLQPKSDLGERLSMIFFFVEGQVTYFWWSFAVGALAAYALTGWMRARGRS